MSCLKLKTNVIKYARIRTHDYEGNNPWHTTYVVVQNSRQGGWRTTTEQEVFALIVSKLGRFEAVVDFFLQLQLAFS